MSQAQAYDLEIVSGERYDRVFMWKTAAGVPIAVTGFQPVMIIYAGDQALYTSIGDDPDIILTPQPSGVLGRIDLYLPYDFTKRMLQPYSAPDAYNYRLDLLDEDLSTNIIPLLYGSVRVVRRVGQ